MIIDGYCTDCGNTGILLDGTPCSCKFNMKSFYDSVSCMEIPEQYRGVHFNSAILPHDIHESYGNYLSALHKDITSLKLQHKNICICSPVAHGKKVFAYSCIEDLFRHGIPVYPVYDVLELKHITLDMDLGRKLSYDAKDPEKIYTVPYLFVEVPRMSNWEVYDSIAMLMSRRVRNGMCTIFLYAGTWNHLVQFDKQETLIGLAGDGRFNTIEVKTWGVDKPAEVEVQFITER